MPKLLTQVFLLRPQSGRVLIGMVAGFTSEWRPASRRNTRPDNVGIRTSDIDSGKLRLSAGEQQPHVWDV